MKEKSPTAPQYGLPRHQRDQGTEAFKLMHLGEMAVFISIHQAAVELRETA